MASPDLRLITSRASAVAAAPDDPVLRLHLGELLPDSGDPRAAIPHLATAPRQDPGSEPAQELMARALGAGPRPAPAAASGPSGSQSPPEAAPAPPSSPRAFGTVPPRG